MLDRGGVSPTCETELTPGEARPRRAPSLELCQSESKIICSPDLATSERTDLACSPTAVFTVKCLT